MILGNVKFHWKYTFVSIRDTCLLLLFSVFFLVCSNQVVVQFCRKIFSSVQLKIYGHNSRWKSERIIFFCCCKKRVTINLPNTRHKIVMSCVFFFSFFLFVFQINVYHETNNRKCYTTARYNVACFIWKFEICSSEFVCIESWNG